MSYTHRTLIVPASLVAKARALTAGIAGDAGDDMFLTALAPTAAGPATHYISTGHIAQDMADLLPLAVATTDPVTGITTVSRVSQGSSATVVLAASAKGITVTKAEIDALFAAIDVTEQKPFEAMARLGLCMVQSGTL